MESLRCSALKLTLILFNLLVLTHSPRASAVEVLKQKSSCEDFHVRLFGGHDKLHSLVGRKCLKSVVKSETGGHHYQTSQDENETHIKFSQIYPEVLPMAVPAFFVLGCLLLCPCFQARKKEPDDTVLSKEPNSSNILAVDSASSLEMNPLYVKFPSSAQRVPPSPQRVPPSPQRVPPSPQRVPPSPQRVPPSSLRVPPSPSRFSMSPKLTRLGSVHLNVSQAAKATNSFSRENRIGEGGFGTVYRAILPSGQVVAIKRARKMQQQFDAMQAEFRSEIELLAKIDHRNLVKLLGYVENGNERLIITEYVPNGTLREHLDGLKEKILDFNQRLEISIDVAHGLTYLHMYSEKQIIHRDVKSSNILLTESVRAKVADFGFAKLGEDSDKSHVITKVKGTMGYLDPEYMRTNQLAAKSDVYSFGILLLEILTGRRPVDLKRRPEERVTIRWAFKKYSEGRYAELLDPLMNETVDDEILAKMLGLAIQCAAPTRADRPDMKAVGEQLWGIRMDYLRNERRL